MEVVTGCIACFFFMCIDFVMLYANIQLYFFHTIGHHITNYHITLCNSCFVQKFILLVFYEQCPMTSFILLQCNFMQGRLGQVHTQGSFHKGFISDFKFCLYNIDKYIDEYRQLYIRSLMAGSIMTNYPIWCEIMPHYWSQNVLKVLN